MVKINPLPSLEILNSLFFYDSLNGNLIWKNSQTKNKSWNSRYSGKIAGTIHHSGYIQIGLGYKKDRKIFLAHRIVWYMCNGKDPMNEIDHINGDRKDNRISNLREATASQNRMNMASRGKWPKGVYKPKNRDNFIAQIKFKGVQEFLGYFKTPEEAHQAYVKRAEELFGGFACHSR
jgi:hypothetical protein